MSDSDLSPYALDTFSSECNLEKTITHGMPPTLYNQCRGASTNLSTPSLDLSKN